MATGKLKTKSGTLYRESVTVGSNLTIGANAIHSQTLSVNASKNGYRPLSIASIASNNNNLNVMRCEINANGVIYARVSNLSNSQITGVSVYATVLYEKL